MLWYLLYPLRGTTEPPYLSPSHPLRRAFTRYATWIAGHVQSILPLSGAVIFFFLYLSLFLYTVDPNLNPGRARLPRHAWTDTQPLGDSAAVQPDIIMRPVWVHGDYMKALERDVLLVAFELQEKLLAKVNDQPSNAWFIHSPFNYWGSADKISSDADIIATVNGRNSTVAMAKTLRHSTIFSDTRVENGRLVAADALVITLVHRRDSVVGQLWKTGAETLVEQEGNWKVIRSSGSRLYEYQFRPLSWSDWLLLSLAYVLIFSYLALRMSKLNAVKSRVGLAVTVLTQIIAAIVSSFSVCGIFKLDLSRIPYYAYPLVVLAISMENSFRLINSVTLTSSAISITDRVGEGFGATAHVAIVNRVQICVILLVSSRITSSGVSAFCTFVAIATLFDSFYLSTFLLSVLSVDLRQCELFELEKATLLRRSKKSADKQLWLDISPTRSAESPVSTRIVSTVVMVIFILIAQSHYGTAARRFQWLHHIFPWDRQDSSQQSSLTDLHQARNPADWIYLQDYETARDILEAIKPGAYSYVARVYDPIVFVLKNASRIPDATKARFLPAFYDFFTHHASSFLLWLLITMYALRWFTDYLIQDRSANSDDSEHTGSEPVLSIRSLNNGHTLDVAMLTASSGGQLVSVGLDRLIQVWDLPSGTRARVLSDPEVPLENPFPLSNIAVDDRGKYLAFVSWQRVFLWDIEQQQWCWARDINLGGSGHRPQAVFFVTKPQETTPCLVIVRRNGTAAEMQLDRDETRDFLICKTPLMWAVSFVDKSNPYFPNTPTLSILTASRRNCIHLVRQHGPDWLSTEVKLAGAVTSRPEPRTPDIHCILPIPTLGMYLVGRAQSVDLVDLDSATVIHTFYARGGTMQPRSLKHVVVSARAGSHGQPVLVMGYVSAGSGELIVQVYMPEQESMEEGGVTPVIEAGRGHPWTRAREIVKRIENPGVWELMPNGAVVGVRRTKPLTTLQSASSTTTTSSFAQGAFSTLRRRAGGAPITSLALPKPAPYTENTSSSDWEAYTYLFNRPDGKPDFTTRDLADEDEDSDTTPRAGNTPQHSPLLSTRRRTSFTQQLMISELGPIIRLSGVSVAVGFGNVIKIVSVGNEHFDAATGVGVGDLTAEGLVPPGLAGLGRGTVRRKKAGGHGYVVRGGRPPPGGGSGIGVGGEG